MIGIGAAAMGLGLMPGMGAAAAGGAGIAGAASGGGMLASLMGGGAMIPGLMNLTGLALSGTGGSSSSGQSYMNNIQLTKEGKALDKEYGSIIEQKQAKSESGDVQDIAATAIGKARTDAGKRERLSDAVFNTAQAMSGNMRPGQRGYGTAGGNLVKANLREGSESMKGKFAPTSILNNYRKNEIMNAASHIQNRSNLKGKVGMFNYSTQLKEYNDKQMQRADKGALFGGIASGIGGSMLQSAYMKRTGA